MWFSVLILMLCLCELFSEKASHVRIHSIHKVFLKKMETHEQEKLPRNVGLLFFYVSGSGAVGLWRKKLTKQPQEFLCEGFLPRFES